MFSNGFENIHEKEKNYELPESHEAIAIEMLFKHAVLTGTILMKAEVCKDNPFNETLQFIDSEWPLQMCLKYKMGNVPRILMHCRRHGTNITSIKKDEFKKNVNKARFKYFYRLFPNTPLPDYIVFKRLANKLPMENLWELERAGQWLAQFAFYPDEQLQQKMGKRWKNVCERSVSLGNEIEEIFQHYQEKIEYTVNQYSVRF